MFELVKGEHKKLFENHWAKSFLHTKQHEVSNPALNSGKTIGCQLHAKSLVKHFTA